MRKPSRNWLRGLAGTLAAVWMSLGVTVLVLAAIEIVPNVHYAWKAVLRVFDPHGGKADWRAAAEVYDGQAWAKAYWQEYFRTGTDWAPYVLWRARPTSGTFVTVEDDGNRRTWPAPASGSGQSTEIWTFGGSTMFGMGARDDHTIASELARILSERGVHVTNFGQPGWVMAQSAIALAEALKTGRRPDLVVFYDGVNDTFGTMAQGTPGWPMNNFNRVREFNLTNADRRGDLAAEAVKGLLPRTMKIVARLSGPVADWPPLTGEQMAARADAVAGYMGATAAQVRALGRAYGFRTVFVLQPIVFSKRLKTPHETRAARDEIQVAAGYEAAYAAIRTQPALTGEGDFVDLSGIFDERPEPFYVDYCHLGEPGNAAVAAALVPAIAAMLDGAQR